MKKKDTIFALASGPGKAAISIIRISGPESIKTINSLSPYLARLAINSPDLNKSSALYHFINSSLFQPICWYSNINLNIQLSNSWRREVNTKVTFIFGKIDFTVQLNDKMKDRLRTLGNNIHIHEVDNAGHWLPLTHKESVIEHI